MPASTSAKKLPYPLGTDRLMDGDDQIRKLAQSVDNMVQAGTTQLTIATANVQVSQAVTFPVAFLSTPTVAIGISSSSPANVHATWGGGSGTGMTIYGVMTTTGTLYVTWIAVGPVVAVT